MKMRSRFLPAWIAVAGIAAAWSVGSFGQSSPSPTPSGGSSGTSDYVFRFNAGLSSVLGSSLNFNNQQSLDLGQCQTTLKVDGAVGCANNCQSQMVCLLVFTGPSGLNSTDILEKVDETPSTSASPTPSTGISGMPMMDLSSRFGGLGKFFNR